MAHCAPPDSLARRDSPRDARRDTGRAEALARIRTLLADDVQAPGGRLPTERDLSEALGTGRRAVRQALDVLEAEGLIWRRQGKGTFAGRPPDPAEALVAELAPEVDPLVAMEARLCIEPPLAALCARRATPEDVARLRLLAGHAARAAHPDSAELWDGSLHRAIAAVAGNRLMMTVMALLDEVRIGQHWQALRQQARSRAAIALSLDQHEAIVDAIARGDAEAASAEMTRHLQTLSDNLRRTLGDARR